MTTLTLHKLPEGFIVTSNEQAKEGELGYIPFQGGDIKTVRKYFADDWKKVIAQQDQIDFSALTEEEQKQIGWFDIDSFIKEQMGVPSYLPVSSMGPMMESQFTSLKNIFQKAQELLSDRRFTLEEVGELFQQIVRIIPEQELRKWTKESFVKHFAALQNRSWTIEVETEEYVQEETGTELKWVGRRPKFTNGKIKILKIK
jgi:hypothetical protein